MMHTCQYCIYGQKLPHPQKYPDTNWQLWTKRHQLYSAVIKKLVLHLSTMLKVWASMR